eukprot:5287700-Amphidinium_carterae.1
MLASLWAGGVGNAELLGVVLEGMVRYPRCMTSPSDMLENAWQKAQRILSSTSLGISGAHHVLPELFAWPRHILLLELIAWQAQATPCLKAFSMIEEAWTELQVTPVHGSEVHPAEFWRTHVLALGIRCFCAWKGLEGAVAPISQTRMTLKCKLSRTWSADLPSRFLNMLVSHGVRALSVVSRHCSPAHSAALALLLFSYRALPRLAEGQCCWCDGASHLSREVHVVIQTGCFRRLSSLEGFQLVGELASFGAVLTPFIYCASRHATIGPTGCHSSRSYSQS